MIIFVVDHSFIIAAVAATGDYDVVDDDDDVAQCSHQADTPAKASHRCCTERFIRRCCY